jgi:hypothetical protein
VNTDFTSHARRASLALVAAVALCASLAPQPTAAEYPARHVDQPSEHNAYLPVVLARARTRMPRFSIALESITPGKGVEQMHQAGVRMMRRWRPISWEEIEPSEGQYRWEALDGLKAELLRAKSLGIQVLLSIQYTPVWARQTPQSSCGAIRDDKHDAFGRFVAGVVERIGPGTEYNANYFVLANEADVAPFEVALDSIYGCWGDPSDAYFGGGRYGAMLKTVYPMAKAVDPRVIVIMSGLIQRCNYDQFGQGGTSDCNAEHLWKSNRFLEGVLVAGAGPYFDVLPIHSYAIPNLSYHSRMSSYYLQFRPQNGGTGLPERTAQARATLARFGYGDKALYGGELNLKCIPNESDACTEINTAFIPRIYAESAMLDLDSALYYHTINPNSNNGLLRPDLSARPTYTAYLTMMNQISFGSYLGPVNSPAGINGAMFSAPAGVTVRVVWSTDGTVSALAKPANFVCATDHMGNPIQLNAAEQIPIGWAPIYVVTQPANRRARVATSLANCTPARARAQRR